MLGRATFLRFAPPILPAPARRARAYMILLPKRREHLAGVEDFEIAEATCRARPQAAAQETSGLMTVLRIV
jgi:hypothetical protein